MLRFFHLYNMEYSLELKVRYNETDNMGVVYHGNYAIYYDLARTEMLRAYGLSYKEIEAAGIALMVSKIEMKYLASARYDDLIKVNIVVKQWPDKRMTIHGKIYNEHEQVINMSKVVLVFYDINDKCSTPLPSFVEEVLKNHLSNPNIN